jgi:hypothetical protein
LSITILLLAGPMYFLGRRAEDERQFLKCYRAPNSPEAEMLFPMEYALESGEYNDVIFIGDSSCRMGIDPIQFTELTGLIAYNLGGQLSLGIEGIQLILDAYLRRHPQPRAVVFCATPNLLDDQPSEEPWRGMHERFLWCFGSGSDAERPKNAKPLYYYVGQGIWTAYGLATGGAERYANEIMPGSGGKSYRAFQEMMREGRGFFAIPNSSKSSFWEERPATVRDAYKSGLRAVERSLSEKNIRLIVRLAPICESEKDRAPVEAAFRESENPFPNARVCRPVVLRYDDDLFRDNAHLKRDGATKFTRLVAEEVSRALTASGISLSPTQSSGTDTERSSP